MVVVCGVITGLKVGTPKADGKRFDTLRVEVGNKTYYPLVEAGMFEPKRDQEVTLLCDVKAKNGFLNLFVVAHVADEMILDPARYSGRASSFDDFGSSSAPDRSMVASGSVQ